MSTVCCWLVAVLLVGCTQAAPELTAEERSWGAAVRQAWDSSGLPSPDQGRCDVGTWSIRYPGECIDQTAYGCIRLESTGQMFRWGYVPVVHVNQWWRVEPAIVQHELLHAYVECSGLHEIKAAGKPHSDPRIWEAGGAESVESRARALVSGP